MTVEAKSRPQGSQSVSRMRLVRAKTYVIGSLPLTRLYAIPCASAQGLGNYLIVNFTLSQILGN